MAAAGPPLSWPSEQLGRECSGARSVGAGSEGQDEEELLLLRMVFVGSQGAVAKLLAEPVVRDRDLSANAASGESVASPAPGLDARFELGFWDAFPSGLQQGVEGALLCVGASGARGESESFRVDAQEAALLWVGSSWRIRAVAKP